MVLLCSKDIAIEILKSMQEEEKTIQKDSEKKQSKKIIIKKGK